MESNSNSGTVAVVFDYDGTLVDSKQVKVRNYLQSFQEIFQAPGHLRQRIEQSCLRTLGASRFAQLEDTLRTLALEASQDQKAAWSRLYSAVNRRTIPRIRLFPSAAGLLRRLQQAGYPLFVASGMPQEELHLELQERHLQEYFIEARGGDKAEILRDIRGRGFQQILFAGDTSFDERTAAEAGISFFRIRTDRDLRRLGSLLLPSRTA
jgi:phosphoglycolate phosphatase-like HAD superfamily hydrolase